MSKKRDTHTKLIRDRIRAFRRVRARDLVPHPGNFRRHPEHQRAALRGVLDEIGYADALLVRETPDGLMLIDGHLRAELTPDQEVPVLVLDVSEAETCKLLAAIDPIAAMAEQDDVALRALLQDVDTDCDALRAMWDDMVPPEIAEGATDPDDVPRPPDTATTEPGDLWILGDHRLLCGDSACAADVDRLLDGARVHLVNTDPPYNVKVALQDFVWVATGSAG